MSLPKKAICQARPTIPEKVVRSKSYVRETQEGVYEVRASNLELILEPGEYWIGLTPMSSQANGFAGHLLADGVRNARYSDVYWDSDDDASAWSAISPTRPDEHLSIRIEGRHIRRGQILDWPTEETTDVKQLHLRFGAFDPLVQPPEIPQELAAADGGNLWIVQSRQPR